MAELVKGEVLRRILEDVLGDRDSLSLIASRSYEHANHFDKIILLDSQDPGAYRMSIHNWHTDHNDPGFSEEPVHNHRFSFWSHIFSGRMLASTYAEVNEEADEGCALPKYKYLPTATGNLHTCEYQGDSRLKLLDSMTYRCGDIYYLNYKTLHRVHFPGRNEKLCTFVLRGPQEREFAETYNAAYPRGRVTYNTPVMAVEHLHDVLTVVLEQT